MITNINEQVKWIKRTKPYIIPTNKLDLIRKKYPKDAITPTSTPITNNGVVQVQIHYHHHLYLLQIYQDNYRQNHNHNHSHNRSNL